MQKNNVKTLIFDLDGTLFQTEELAIVSFVDTINRLKEDGMYDREIPDKEVFLSLLGKTCEEIWAELLCGASDLIVKKADDYLYHYEMLHLKQGIGNPYPGVVDTLKRLKEKGYFLCVASNGGEGYVSEVVDYYFNGIFDAVYSAGGYNTKSKVDLVRLILEKFPDKKPMVMVGDRSSDMEAGKKNQLFTIGCKYGFGNNEEVVDADYLITDFAQLTELFS